MRTFLKPTAEYVRPLAELFPARRLKDSMDSMDNGEQYGEMVSREQWEQLCLPQAEEEPWGLDVKNLKDDW